MTLSRLLVLPILLLIGIVDHAHASDTAAQREAGWQRHEQLVAGSLFNGMEWRSIGPTV